MFVAVPVRARHAEKLEGLDSLCGFDMRPRAKVHVFALLVKAYLLALGKRLDELDLVGLVLFLHERYRLVLGEREAAEGEVLFYDLFHLLLDLRKFIGGEKARLAVEIVIEAVRNGGPDGELHAGVKPLDGLGHYVRSGVAKSSSAVFVVEGQKLQRCVPVNNGAKVGCLAVNAAHTGIPVKAFADAFADIRRGHRVLEFSYASVFQCYFHKQTSLNLDRQNRRAPGFERRPLRVRPTVSAGFVYPASFTRLRFQGAGAFFDGFSDDFYPAPPNKKHPDA